MFLGISFSSLSTKPIKQGRSLIAVPPNNLYGKQIGDQTCLLLLFENLGLMIWVRHAHGRCLRGSFSLQYSYHSIRCHVPHGWIFYPRPSVKKHENISLSLDLENESSSALPISTSVRLPSSSALLSPINNS